MCVEVFEHETVDPLLLMQVQQHLLLEFVLAIVDGDGIVVAVESMDQCLEKEEKRRSLVGESEVDRVRLSACREEKVSSG